MPEKKTEKQGEEGPVQALAAELRSTDESERGVLLRFAEAVVKSDAAAYMDPKQVLDKAEAYAAEFFKRAAKLKT